MLSGNEKAELKRLRRERDRLNNEIPRAANKGEDTGKLIRRLADVNQGITRLQDKEKIPAPLCEQCRRKPRAENSLLCVKCTETTRRGR